ncbi:hypothetical protein D3C80_2141550 [compost metagenome]
MISNETQELADTQAVAEGAVEEGLGAPTDGNSEVVEPAQEDKSDDIKMKILRSKIDK